MVFYTGDPHGDVAEIVEFCRQMRLQPADTLVILGDVGGQLLSERAGYLRQGAAQRLRPNGFVHPRQPRVPARPSARVWAAGLERRPGVCPAGVFPCPVRRGRRDLHAGRAGSPGDWRRLQLDKYYRLMRGFRWWEDEQPDEATKAKVEQVLAVRGWQVPVVLSHTCPFKYEPVEAFLPGIDQSSVDASTERWLDTIDDRLTCDAWYCGHWHINKRIEKMHFLFHEFEAAPKH